MESHKAIYARIKALFAEIPEKQGWRRPEGPIYGRRIYRGKQQFVAGYWHSRSYAHFARGSTYDRILGYGETQDEAIENMRLKIIKLKSRAEID